jgi:peptidoglycan/LPS O-acetylase OafA/YrhL
MLNYLATKLTRITSSGNYTPEVDGVRFVAISLVLVQHLHERVYRLSKDKYPAIEGSVLDRHLITGGAGVMLFFALSGYILFSLLIKELENKGEINIGRYFWRRLTRLEPPYVIISTVIFLTLAFGLVKGSGKYLGGGNLSLPESWLSTITYTHSLITGAPSSVNPPGWSLEIEVQFYIVAPLLALVISSIRTRFSRIGLALVAIVILCYYFRFGLKQQPRLHYSLLQWLPFFLSGFVVFELSRVGPVFLYSWARTLLADLCALAGIVLILLCKKSAIVPLDLLRCIFITGVLYGCLYGKVIRSVMMFRWIAIIGGMCYTIYLIHLPIQEVSTRLAFRVGLGAPYPLYLILQGLLTLPIVLFASAIFYLLIERPCMRPTWPADALAWLKQVSSRRVDAK